MPRKEKVKAEKVKVKKVEMTEELEEKNESKETNTFSEKVKNKTENFERGVRYKNNRILAALFDILLVGVLTTFLVSNTITNPFYGTEGEIQKEFNTTYNAKVEEITEDENVSEKEVRQLMKEIAPTYRVYSIRSTFALYFWYMALVVFYFGIFAYMNNGQTLFKKLYGLRVVDNKTDESATMFQMIRRNLFGGLTLLMGNNLVMLLSLLNMVFIKNGYYYTITFFAVTGLGLVIDVVFLALFFFKKNGRSLDDLVGGTKVIDVPKKNVLNKN